MVLIYSILTYISGLRMSEQNFKIFFGAIKKYSNLLTNIYVLYKGKKKGFESYTTFNLCLTKMSREKFQSSMPYFYKKTHIGIVVFHFLAFVIADALVNTNIDK